MKNILLREKIRKNKLTHWQIADYIGVSEFTLCRWFRKELSAEQRERVLNAIEQLKGGEKHDL